MSDFEFIDNSQPYDKNTVMLEIAHQLNRIADALQKDGE